MPAMLPSIKNLISDISMKVRNSCYNINMKELKWISSVTSDYLRNNDFDLECEVDNLGNSLLHKLVQLKDAKPLELIISKITNVNKQNNIGETPLHIACRINNLAGAKILLSYFADVNCQDMEGNTPLMNVVSRKISDCQFITFLLEREADLSLENNNHEKAWDIGTSCRLKSKILKLLNPYYM